MKRMSGSERALARQMEATASVESVIHVRGSRWRDVLGEALLAGQSDIANFKIDLSDKMISTLQKACKGKEVEITEDQLKA